MMKLADFQSRVGWISVVAAIFLAAGAPMRVRAQICGANAKSAIATDRPQITNSSVVVPCRSLQFENGLQVTGSSGVRGFDLPETGLRLGVANKTELRFSVPEYFLNAGSATGANGFGDLGVGVKQQLGPAKGFDVSVIAAVSLPGGANAISSHGYDAVVQAPWSRSLSKNWTVAGQVGVGWPTSSGRHNATGQGSVYFDRQMSATVDAFVEYAGGFPQRGGPQHLVDFGAAYKPTPHQQLDVHCGMGLSAAVPDYVVGLGYSVRFQVRRGRG